MRLIALLLCLLCSSWLQAQMRDDFSDGDFSNNPTWGGNSSSFIVNTAKQLQLKAPAAGTAYLSTQSALLNNTRWEFTVRVGFSPSTASFCRIYLGTDKNDLSASVNGYFIQIGDAGNEDAVDLYRQDGATVTRILQGVKGRAYRNHTAMRIRVDRDQNGNWAVFSDTALKGRFAPEGKALDNTYKSVYYCGVYAKFSASYTDKINWDDFRIATIFGDTTIPQLRKVAATGPYTVLASFSEILSLSSAKNSSNYTLQPGSMQPTSVTMDNDSTARLSFSAAFQDGQAYQLEVSGINDTTFNTLWWDTASFRYYEVLRTGAVVLNEIYADTTPRRALPPSQYI
jgi:hypothetical protein